VRPGILGCMTNSDEDIDTKHARQLDDASFVAPTSTHAYLALEKTDHAVRAYVGIGRNYSRAFEPHTESVDELLKNAFATFGTTRPFSTRQDAELAEALTIQALVKAGVEVGNKQKTVSPSDIQPLLERKHGTVRYSELRNTFVVKVGADEIGEGIDVRQGVVGFDPVKVSMRCDRYWDLGAAVREGYKVDRLVAVLLGAPIANTPIVGCWATEPLSEWDAANGIVKLVEPAEWDRDGWRGMRLDWEGRHPQKQQWSDDLGQ
jgi:hypothetical protein